MKIEINNNLIERVIRLRLNIDIPPSNLENYKEAITDVVDGLLRWAIAEIHTKTKKRKMKERGRKW